MWRPRIIILHGLPVNYSAVSTAGRHRRSGEGQSIKKIFFVLPRDSNSVSRIYRIDPRLEFLILNLQLTERSVRFLSSVTAIRVIRVNRYSSRCLSCNSLCYLHYFTFTPCLHVYVNIRPDRCVMFVRRVRLWRRPTGTRFVGLSSVETYRKELRQQRSNHN